ncbi:MAG: helix-turn-helix domain-containing protein [Pseudonocardiaceae bacterium]
MSTENRGTEIASIVARLVEMVSDQPPAERAETRRMPDRVLLTVEEVADLLGIGRTTAFRLVKTGEIESVRIGRLRRIHIDAVNAYAARLIAA